MSSYENTKVLMALMGMEIGGAETHVLELCKSLRRRGLDVYVVSNGGVYVEELVRHGIKHFKLPLHNKNPKNLITSYFSLKRIIKENDIRLVHAHARIPAFLCGLLQKHLHFRFVTTAHAHFSNAMAYKLLTNFGEASLSVAQDIKENLVKNYRMSEDNVFLTINGIDTDKFTPDVDFSDILSELDIPTDCKRIVNISRMDRDMSHAAHRLIELAPQLYEKNPNTRIVIVGSGNDYDAIVEKAQGINDSMGIKHIIVTGTRTDIPKFLAAADIFVGVSRSVLEAMACAKPAILAGGQGYLGVLNKNVLDTAIATNFTCRGHEEVAVQNLSKDLFNLLDSSPKKLAELGSMARTIIEENYSLDKMADDALMLYDCVRKPNRAIDAVISGYYGSNNHGDDILLKAITDDLRAIHPEIKITVISKRPKETKSIYNVESIQRFNFPRIIASLRKANLLIMGGGSLIQDLTSTKSLIYYVFVMNLAALARAKVMLYANGIGPLKLEKNQRRAAAALEKVEKITLRDQQSKIVLQELGLKNESVIVTADAAFGFTNTNPDASSALLDKINLIGKKYFCVSIRGWKTLKEDFVSEMAVFCDYMSEKHGLYPLFIPMQPSNDAEISTQVMEVAKRQSYYLQEDFTIEEILSVVAGAEFLVGMRLHSIIYGANTATPVIGLVYDPKVSSMLNELNQKYYVDLEDISAGKLINFSEEILEKRDEISRELCKITRPMIEKAQSNAQIAYDIINRDEF
ncbi:MAG: polysaccharide pyruvyl transferase CsaB [Defluviitaleaceae bacterium]|nr:polysaccharide pyruvyl transferase CsaB [Defluviitaleaceae bacterium]